MTDVEFAILDEVYFVISYNELRANLEDKTIPLAQELENLLKKGWIKCFQQNSDVEVLISSDFNLNYKNYNYLATKSGLLAHNSTNE